MKFPCELLAEPYLAQLRVNLAHNLRDLKYTQTEIAELLQVSQPVISGYLKKSLHQDNLPPVILSKAREVANDITTILHQKGKSGTEEAIRRGCYDCKIMRQSGPTCVYHKSVTSDLGETCTSCLTEKPLIDIQQNKQGVITDLHHLYNYLVDFDNIDRIIPEIGLQIILSINTPNTMSDIAAFPGRIIKRKQSQPIADTPIFGGSETTSQLLLELNKKDLNLRAIAAVKTTEWLINRIQKIGLPSHIISGFEENFIKNIEELEITTTPFVIIGIDSVGYESISYICSQLIDDLKDVFTEILS